MAVAYAPGVLPSAPGKTETGLPAVLPESTVSGFPGTRPVPASPVIGAASAMPVLRVRPALMGPSDPSPG